MLPIAYGADSMFKDKRTDFLEKNKQLGILKLFQCDIVVEMDGIWWMVCETFLII